MPRRMEHYGDPSWQPWLIAASLGAGLILIGIVCLAAQVAVSIRDRRASADLTGDPWDGRTLEWAMSSPPPAYAFAVLPQVDDREPLLDMKQRGVVFKKPPRYQDIEMPKNSAVGVVMGGLSFALGFAMVWHIWWLALGSALRMWIALIVRASNDDAEYVLPAERGGAPGGGALAGHGRGPRMSVDVPAAGHRREAEAPTSTSSARSASGST